jgi:hypothetical protein
MRLSSAHSLHEFCDYPSAAIGVRAYVATHLRLRRGVSQGSSQLIQHRARLVSLARPRRFIAVVFRLSRGGLSGLVDASHGGDREPPGTRGKPAGLRTRLPAGVLGPRVVIHRVRVASRWSFPLPRSRLLLGPRPTLRCNARYASLMLSFWRVFSYGFHRPGGA